MPVYDFKCDTCGDEQTDVYIAAVTKTVPCAKCGGICEHLWRPSGVISDECDVWIKNGICNADGSPRHYYFKSEMKAEADRRGLSNIVRHQGEKGSDKSKHTSRWV